MAKSVEDELLEEDQVKRENQGRREQGKWRKFGQKESWRIEGGN